MSQRRRFDYATELRAFAAQVDALQLANRRDPEAPIITKVDLARAMRERADQVVRMGDTPPDMPFRIGLGRSAAGHPFRAEVKGRPRSHATA